MQYVCKKTYVYKSIWMWVTTENTCFGLGESVPLNNIPQGRLIVQILNFAQYPVSTGILKPQLFVKILILFQFKRRLNSWKINIFVIMVRSEMW